MKFSVLKSIFTNSFHIAWAVLVTALFVFYSGTISHLYGSYFSNWLNFADKLHQINFGLYFTDLIIAFTGAACFTLLCASFGSVFFTQDTAQKLSPSGWLGDFITAFLIGEILFSFILLGLAILGKLSPFNTSAILLTGGAIGIFSFKKLILAYRKSKENHTNENRSKTENLIFWLSIAVLASAALFTTARLSYDSTAFYFSDAKLTAMNHQLVFFPNDSYVVSSFHTGILYTALIQIAGDQSARFFSWMSGAFIIIISMAMAEQAGVSNKGKIILLALLVTSTAFLDPFGDGKIELTASLPALTSIYWLVGAAKNNSFKSYVLAGLFAGFAIIARPYNLVLLGGFMGIYFLAGTDSLKSRLKSYTFVAGTILIMLGMHLFANWAILGDPFAPVNNTITVSTTVWQWSGFDPQNIWLARIFFPFVATFLNTPQSMGTITPLVLIILPVYFRKKTSEHTRLSGDLKKISLIALFILTTWIMVSFTIFEIRYVFFLWILIYLASAELIKTNLESLQPASRNIFSCTLVLLLIYIFARNLFIAVDAHAPNHPNGDPQCNDSMFCNTLLPINQTALAGERVLGLSAFRYYLRPDLFACSSKADEYYQVRSALEESNQTFWLEVHRQGYTHIAYEENYSLRHLFINFLPTLENTPSWVKVEKLSETFDGYFSTYKIEFINAPNQSEKACANHNNIWLVQDLP